MSQIEKAHSLFFSRLTIFGGEKLPFKCNAASENDSHLCEWHTVKDLLLLVLFNHQKMSDEISRATADGKNQRVGMNVNMKRFIGLQTNGLENASILFSYG